MLSKQPVSSATNRGKLRLEMSMYVSFDKKNIIVNPGEQIQAGVSTKSRKSHGWLRVGTGSNARFYSLPIQDGQLHESVQSIVDSIIRQQTCGEIARFFWERLKNGVRWIDVAAQIKQEKEYSEILDSHLN